MEKDRHCPDDHEYCNDQCNCVEEHSSWLRDRKTAKKMN